MRPLTFATKLTTRNLSYGMFLILLALSPVVSRADVILGNLGAGDGGNVMIRLIAGC